MGDEYTAFVRVGAWGQLGAVAAAALCWLFGTDTGLLLACGCYLLVTVFGVGAMAEAESLPTAGPLVFPFLLPGFLPLYYVGTQY